jgi:putative ABC transport system permease protein
MRNLFHRLFRRRAIDAEAREEIDAHVRMRAARNRQLGMTEDEALRQARLQFGNASLVREEVYRFNGFGILDELGKDIRCSLRTLRRYPGVTAVALLSLALGIGANTLAFSFVNVLLFHTLPYPDSAQLVMSDDGIASDDCRVLREHAKETFEEIGCFAVGDSPGASFADGDAASLLPEHVFGQRMSAGAGRALGIKPLSGRWLSEVDEVGAGGAVIVISHRLWQQRFGGTEAIVGKRVRIDGDAATIIGVMPDDFEFLRSNVDYWVPLRTGTATSPSAERNFGVVARLRRDATLPQAQSRLDALMGRRTELSNEPKEPARILLTPIEQFVRAQLQDTALILQGTVVFVLLIACANVAGLLLTQALSQQREVAVRAALGAGVWRILRQTVVHSIVLFSAGGFLGLLVGWAGVRVMVNVVLPSAISAYGAPRGGLPRAVSGASVDATVMAFTFAISVVCGLAAAIAPARYTSQAQPLDVLRESNRTATPGVGRQRLRSIFVMVQISLAFVLLVGAALMLNGLTRSVNQNLGFDPANLVTVRIQLPQAKVSRDDAVQLEPRLRFNSERMRQNLAAISGVASASAIAVYPPLSGALNMPIEIDGRHAPNGIRTQFMPIMPDYFKTLGVAVVQGREFVLGDSSERLPVAIINETAARRFWPNESPLGKQIRIDSTELPGEPARQVIGVVTEVKQYSFQEPRPQLYVPYNQLQLVKTERFNSQLRAVTFIVQTQRPADEIAPAIAAAINRADSTQAISSITTMRKTAFAGAYRRSVIVRLIALFGAVAVLLAVIGVYGMMAHTVRNRFNELGIRIALGANPGQIRRLVIRRGVKLVGVGMLAGIILSVALTRVVRSLLFGASATDPTTFVLGVLLLGGVALLACYIPAWRASRIDAVTALRHD